MRSLYPANPIASNPIQLSKSKSKDLWDPRRRPLVEPMKTADDSAHLRSLISNKEPASTLPDHRSRYESMELIGFEPTTSALQGRRSPN